ncbi:MAG TPA: protein kinase [Aliidongia sp.]|uniref:serine/threonine-protein kinase n=1 Tax=Aliidongia sp. TaxID=1914230 RepID=UPI002DDD5B01|nr:protein kinase [Aliidongia sp.]HEV2675039.1 protein kinase [Aliidongia sp.]
MSGLTNPPGNDLPAPKSADDEEATRIFAPQPSAIVAAQTAAAAEPTPPPAASVAATSAPSPAPKIAPSLASITTGAILAHTYEIEALLARGGMGEVYRARHTELGSQHAIKVILPALASEARFISLFQEEARKLRRVRDDAVVGYEGLFLDENGLRYLVMEFVDGPSLAQVMTQRRLSTAELLQLRDRIARGLAAAHEKGIYHRDISPDNIILVEDRADQAKIIDFGIAKSTEPGDRTVVGQDFAGKYSWVSPEQLGLYGGKVDGRSDIYSLGLVLAAAVIGRPLPMGNSPISVIEARRAVPDLSQVPEELRPVIAPLLEPNPEDRPQSMRDLLAGVPAPTRPVITQEPPPDFDFPAPEPAGTTKTAPVPPPKPVEIATAKRSSALPIAAVAVISFAAAAGAGWYFLRPAPEAVPTVATVKPVVVPDATPKVTPPPVAAEVSSPTPQSPTQTATAAAGPVPRREDILAAAQQVTSAYQCAHLTVSLGNDLKGNVTGFVSSQLDLSGLRASLVGLRGAEIAADGVKVFERPFCSIVQSLDTTTTAGAPAVEFNRSSKIYHNGDKLVLNARTGDRDGYLYVDYIDNTGSVVHMQPLPGKPAALVKAGTRVTLGTASPTPKANEKIYEVSEPFGSNMIVTFVSPKPLFDRPRPEQEAYDQYSDALEAALRRTGPGVDSSYSFFETQP